MTISRKDYKNIRDAIYNNFYNNGEDVSIRSDYRGRGMFSCKCLGFSVSNPISFALEFGVICGREIGENDDDAENIFTKIADKLPEINWDSLGSGSIVYFPNVQVDEIKDEDFSDEIITLAKKYDEDDEDIVAIIDEELEEKGFEDEEDIREALERLPRSSFNRLYETIMNM